MSKEKNMRSIDMICDMLDQMQQTDLNSAAKVGYYKDLAKLRYYLRKECEDEEKKEYSQMRGMAYREGPEWGAYADGSMRGRNAMGRYTSGDPFSYGAEPRDQIRTLMQDPSIGYEAKEALRKAMEAMR